MTTYQHHQVSDHGKPPAAVPPVPPVPPDLPATASGECPRFRGVIRSIDGRVLFHAPEGVDLRAAVELAVANGVSLRGADLAGADLSGARLDGGNFSSADLIKVRFTGARLVAATFCESHLRQADFTGAELSFSIFDGADCTGAKFDNLKGNGFTSFSGARGGRPMNRHANESASSTTAAPVAPDLPEVVQAARDVPASVEEAEEAIEQALADIGYDVETAGSCSSVACEVREIAGLLVARIWDDWVEQYVSVEATLTHLRTAPHSETLDDGDSPGWHIDEEKCDESLSTDWDEQAPGVSVRLYRGDVQLCLSGDAMDSSDEYDDDGNRVCAGEQRTSNGKMIDALDGAGLDNVTVRDLPCGDWSVVDDGESQVGSCGHVRDLWK